LKIYSFIDEFSSFIPCVFTLGVFDGVHRGHKKIIQDLVFRTKKEKLFCSVLLTFHPHPREILEPNREIFYLNTLSERIYNLKKTGIEHLIIHPFTVNFSKLSTKDFLQKIVSYKLKIKKFIIGYDSHIGRDGSSHHLREFSPIYGFKLYQVNPYKFNKKIISSTNIRESLTNGKIEWANQALGYSYTLSGFVIKGNRIGRILNYPTANVQVDTKKLIPKKGVYAVKINYLHKTYQGMLNIGVCPTIKRKNKKVKIEVHIFDFHQNIYGKKIDIFIIKIIREEKRFNTLQDLKMQMDKDQIKIKDFFHKYRSK